MHILQKVPRLLARTSRLSPCVTRSFYIYSPEPLHALLGKQPTWKTADQAVEAIQSGKQKYVHWLLSRNSVNSVFLFFVALEIGCRSSAMGFLSWMALHVYLYTMYTVTMCAQLFLCCTFYVCIVRKVYTLILTTFVWLHESMTLQFFTGNDKIYQYLKITIY